MNSKQVRTSTRFGVAGVALALMASIPLIGGCSQGFAKADRVVSAEDGQLTITEDDGLNQKTYEVAVDAEVLLDGEPAALEELDRGDAVKLTTETRDGISVVKKIDAKSKEKVEANGTTYDLPMYQPAAPSTTPTTQPSQDTSQEPSELSEPLANPPRTEVDRTMNPAEGTTDEAEGDAQKVEDDVHEVEGDAQKAEDDAQKAEDDAQKDSAVSEQSFSGKINSLGDSEFVVKDDNNMEHTFTVNDETKYTLDGDDANFDDLKVSFSVQVTAKTDDDTYVAETVDATSDDSAK